MCPRAVISVLVVCFCLASTEGRAFKKEKARFKRQAGGRCDGGFIQDDVGAIDIGFGQYQNNEDCCFEMRPFFGGSFTVELEFNVFDIENGPRCSYDSITYRTSNGNTEIDCGTKNPGYTRFFNSTGSFQLCFHSDSSVVRGGINVYYYIYPDSPSMNFTTAFPSYNETTSPTLNFTLPYNNATSSPNGTLATGNMTVSPCSRAAAPSYTTVVPGNTTVAPGNTTFAPGNTTVAPGNTTVAPGNTTAAPGNTTAAPGNTTFAPGNTTVAPSNTTFAPGNTTVAPGNTTVAPGNTTAAPGNTTTAPGNTTLAPGNTTVAPGNNTFAPGNTTVAPGNTTAAPGNTTAAPGNTTFAPGNTTVAPGNTTFAPGNTTVAPGNTTVAPGNTTAAPGNTTAAPGNTTFAPGNTTVAPGNTTFAPGNTTVAPGNTTVAPGNTTAAPGNTTAAPGNTTVATGNTTVATGNRTMTQVCNYDTTALEGTIELATDTDGFYANNDECRINLRSPALPHVTTISFTRFDVEYASNCPYDSLSVSLGNNTVDRLCGNNRGPFVKQYTSTETLLALTFTSDYSVTGLGFAFHYKTEIVA